MPPTSLLDTSRPALSDLRPVRKTRGQPGWRLAQLLLALLLAAFSYMGWRHLYPVVAETGWRHAVFLDGTEKVSAIALEADGALLLSEELQNGAGRILRYRANGRIEPVAVGLSKPDGMLSYRGGVVLSQEQGDYPVLWRTPERTLELFAGRNVEGLTNDGQYLYAIEDRHGDGRLLRYNHGPW